MNHSTHLTIEERACIALYRKQGKSQAEIARLLERSPSVISRELKRNSSYDGSYNAVGAQRKYKARRKGCASTPKLVADKDLLALVCKGLSRYWSPEQIAQTLPKGKRVCFNTIYRAISKGLIPKEFCIKLRRYGKRLKHKGKKTGIAYDFSSVRPIAQRPLGVGSRNRYGHWELDTIVLRKESGCHIATFVERKSRLVLMRRIPNKKAVTMSDAIITAMSCIPPKLRKTFTVDRGLEFTDWQRLESELNVKVYFCDPYSPHQRGTNENTNGLIRQFFPRKTILPEITDEAISKVENLLNNRPRKCLGWNTPYQKILLHLG